jgi:hypothetical protein
VPAGVTAHATVHRGGAARLLRAAILLALAAGYLGTSFQLWGGAFWRGGIGDWLDPYFINYLLEHWYYTLGRLTDPSSPPMFHPAAGTLGYSHGLILFAPFYVPVRLLAHPLQAHNLTLLLVILTGILSLHVIVRRFLRLSFVESLLLLAFFVGSANVLDGAIGIWSQRVSMFLVPPILLLVLLAREARPGWSRQMLAGIAGLATTLMWTQDFSSAQFTLMFAGAAALPLALVAAAPAAAAALRCLGKTSWSVRLAIAVTLLAAVLAIHVAVSGGGTVTLFGLRLRSTDWRRPALLAAAALGVLFWRLKRLGAVSSRGTRPALLASGLLLIVTGAVAAALVASGSGASPGGGGDWRTPAMLAAAGVALLASVHWSSTVVPGVRSLPGWVLPFACGAFAGVAVFAWIYLPAYREFPGFPEKDYLRLLVQLPAAAWQDPAGVVRSHTAYASLRPFLFVSLVALLVWLPGTRLDRRTRYAVLWALAVSAVVLAIPLQFGEFSIWGALFHPLPGFNAMRDPLRIIYHYELALVLAAGVLLAALRRRPVVRIGVCAILAVLIVSWPHQVIFSFHRSNAEFDRWVAAPVEIAPSCQSFVMTAAPPEYIQRSREPWTLYSIDAMFISLRNSIPTLHGYSAWTPREWRVRYPGHEDFDEGLEQWSAMHGLEGVCELDVERRVMTPLGSLPADR